jgi:hypothetical protein
LNKHKYYLSKDGILDYLETAMLDVSARRQGSSSNGPFWWQQHGSPPLPIPSLISVGSKGGSSLGWKKEDMNYENVILAGDDQYQNGSSSSSSSSNSGSNSSSSNSSSSLSSSSLSSSSSSSSSSVPSVPSKKKRKVQKITDPSILAALAKRRKS